MAGCKSLLFLAVILAGHQAAGRLHGACVQRRADVSGSGAAAGRAADLRLTGVDESTKCAGPNTPSPCCCSALVSMLVLYLMERLQACTAVQSAETGGVLPEHLAFNTAASFTTNTNWQAYSGETTMSYFTQMAGPGVSQLCFGRGRHRAGDRLHSRHRAASDADHRQLLGGSRAVLLCGCCCRSASWARCCSCRRAWCRT